MTAYFVTGAGTEIGKTYVAAALLGHKRQQGARVAAVKPLMSGYARERLDLSDAGVLLSACGRPVNEAGIADICLYAFEPALAPNVAAQLAGIAIDEATLIDFVRERIADPEVFALVEGAGGVMAPASDKMTNIDLMAALSLPVIFVAASYLGAISHALTALEALDRRGLRVAAIVATQPRAAGPAPEALIDELARWRSEPFVAAPFGADPDALGAALGAALAGRLEAQTATPTEVPAETVVDARGLRCPLPVLLMERALRRAAPGRSVTIIADDPVAAVDIPHFAAAAGASAARLPGQGGACVFRVTPGGK